MIDDPPVAPVVYVGTLVLWGLFSGVLGFFVGKFNGYDEGLAEGRRRYLRDTQDELRRRRQAEAAQARAVAIARDLGPPRRRWGMR